MRAAWLLGAAALAFGAALLFSHGCIDDRGRVASESFSCNPTSPTADSDCGAGYACYAPAQAFGGAFCVPKCDPGKTPSTCSGICTQGGECLQRCTVPRDAPDGGVSANPCPGALRCVRVTNAPLDVAGGQPDGVCLALNSICASNDDCTSAIFNYCTSDLSGYGPGVPASGSFCAQGGCFSRGVACEPGSSCILELLPASTNAPDTCSPDCVPRRTASGTVLECVPGFTCLTTAFPQDPHTRVCLPGFAGFLCSDGLGCSQGHCESWTDVPNMDGFKACAPPCAVDDDCIPFETRIGNPSAFSKMTCHAGFCRTPSSLYNAIACNTPGQVCGLDDQAICGALVASADGGVPNAAPSGLNCNLSLASAAAIFCQRPCAGDDDCATLTKNSHQPWSCGPPIGPPGSERVCLPATPMASCLNGQTCIGDLRCLGGSADGTQPGLCTRTCSGDPDCARDPVLGIGFYCAKGLCLPRTSSGCAPAEGLSTSACLSGRFTQPDGGAGVCVSPSGWACNDSAECLSGRCDCSHFQGAVCLTGRCR